MAKGSIFIVSGPSGVGKGTVVKRVIEESDNIYLSISCTTRAPRTGEQEGVNYFYISKEEFEKRIENSFFIEWERYVDNYYGTPAAPLLEAVEKGKNAILEIEVGGAMQAKNRYPEAVLVFVVPPENDTLKKRIIGRDEGNEVALAALEKRISRAKEEYQYIDKYDYLLVNDDLDRCVDQLKNIIASESYRVKNNNDIIEKIMED